MAAVDKRSRAIAQDLVNRMKDALQHPTGLLSQLKGQVLSPSLSLPTKLRAALRPKPAPEAPLANADRTRAIGEALLGGLKGESPSLFDKAWWSGQIMEWSMKDEGFKTEMFRFVDAFPVLRSPEEVFRHLEEYLLKPGINVPMAIRVALKGAGLAQKLAVGQIAKNIEGMAKNFIAGTEVETALKVLDELRQQGQAFTVDLLGEAVVGEAEAEAFAGRYHGLISGLADQSRAWPERPNLDRDDRGPIPKVNVSVKVSAMTSQFDPLAFDASLEAAAARLVPLFVLAKEKGAFINLDLEQYAVKDLTLALFKRVMEDPRLAGFEDAGLVVQAYLRDSEQDLEDIIAWAKRRKQRITVRLVKGAYWDYETVFAEQNGWPCPVWLDKVDSDACFERLATRMLQSHDAIRSAFGTHNIRSISHILATAEALNLDPRAFEIQCLFGMAEPVKAVVINRGHRLRTYATVGELIPGMAYLVRRLLENTSNESWLRLSFAENASVDTLLATPKPQGRGPMLRAIPPLETNADAPPPFVNEPLRNFSVAAEREAFFAAVGRVPLGQTYMPLLSGQPVETGRMLASTDPGDPNVVIGQVHLAGVAEIDRALAEAKAAFPRWRDTPVKARARCLFKLAALMRQERDALAALMLRECGKAARQADADVVEAIDFCEYYGREMLRLGKPTRTQKIAGETNHLLYEPRGVCVVISPWNFPLAILCGMATAALVAGNSVVIKPAGQAMVIAARLVALAHQAGVPKDVIHFMPCSGREVGGHLVSHPDVNTVAFTGSREVGLSIWQAAGITHPGQRHLKNVICEMGGKNALIVDSDADLDEAVKGAVVSAFGYSGQKCSACSRILVHQDAYEAFLTRFLDATRSLTVGPATDPRTEVGPVIGEDAKERLTRAIARGQESARMLLGGSDDRPGAYVRPTVFVDVKPDDPLFTDELFGPVVAVVKVKDIDEALTLALSVDYALTGGLYSRSPSHIQLARERFRVGNLYINRNITGAIVGRQPFGGYAMSGGGTKAGGPDYLLHFLVPRVVTENTLRRGFAPSED